MRSGDVRVFSHGQITCGCAPDVVLRVRRGRARFLSVLSVLFSSLFLLSSLFLSSVSPPSLSALSLSVSSHNLFSLVYVSHCPKFDRLMQFPGFISLLSHEYNGSNGKSCRGSGMLCDSTTFHILHIVTFYRGGPICTSET